MRKHGASPVVWEEMITEWGVDLAKDVIVQVWLGDESVKNVTTQGYRTITGSYQFWVRQQSVPWAVNIHSLALTIVVPGLR